MQPDEKEKLLQRIRSLGFEPFPCPDDEEFDTNPGRIITPERFNPNDWLTLDQCVMLTSKAFPSARSVRTIYRWQEEAAMINVTNPLDA